MRIQGKFFAILVLFFLLVWASNGLATEVIWPVNGHAYEAVYAPGLTWAQAQAACVARGGYLATVTSVEENDFIKALFENNSSFWYVDGFNNALGPWIGGIQAPGSPEPAGGWGWVTGEAFSYTDWSSHDPDNCCGVNQNRIEFIRDGNIPPTRWTDVEDFAGFVRGYIFERTNRKPLWTPIGNHGVNANQLLSFCVSASDSDGTTPALTATPLPAGAAFVDSLNGRGRFSWTPTSGQLGTYVVGLIASDGALADTCNVTINVVSGVNFCPVGVFYRKNGDSASDHLGWEAVLVGDLNGDNIPDFMVGAGGTDPGGLNAAGSVFVYSGADGALLYQKNGTTADENIGNGSLASAGDINADGRDDFLIGSPLASPGGSFRAGSVLLYSGASGALLLQKNGSSSGDWFGNSVASIGDINNDGIPDFVVGAPFASPGGINQAGSAYVLSGATGSLIYQKNGTGTYDNFGVSVGAAGEINGDGTPDFIVGASANFDFVDKPGSAFIYSGATGALLHRIDGNAVDDRFGSAVAGLGDIDGDGLSDVAIGAIWADPGGVNRAGSAYVFSGAMGGLLYKKDGTAPFDHFGESVGEAGDVDGDGQRDFLVGGAKGNVFSGATGALLFQTNLGTSPVSGGRDLTGDGRADFIMGAPSAFPNGIPFAGSAFVFGCDIIPPVVTCPPDTAINNTPGQCRRVVSFAVDATDNFATQPTIFCSPSAGANFNVGTTLVTCIATDGVGNKDTCTFSIMVNDVQPPVMTCPGNFNASRPVAQCSSVVNFSTIETDNCPGVTKVCTPPSGSTFPIGSTLVACVATDAHSNQDTCNFSITLPRGDMDGNGSLSPADVVLLLNCVFLASGDCNLCFADVNCSGDLSPADVVLELILVFLGTPLPC